MEPCLLCASVSVETAHDVEVREKQRAVLEAALAKQPLGAITGAFETPMASRG